MPECLRHLCGYVHATRLHLSAKSRDAFTHMSRFADEACDGHLCAHSYTCATVICSACEWRMSTSIHIATWHTPSTCAFVFVCGRYLLDARRTLASHADTQSAYMHEHKRGIRKYLDSRPNVWKKAYIPMSEKESAHHVNEFAYILCVHTFPAGSEQAVAEFEAETFFEQPIRPLESIYIRMLGPTVSVCLSSLPLRTALRECASIRDVRVQSSILIRSQRLICTVDDAVPKNFTTRAFREIH